MSGLDVNDLPDVPVGLCPDGLMTPGLRDCRDLDSTTHNELGGNRGQTTVSAKRNRAARGN